MQAIIIAFVENYEQSVRLKHFAQAAAQAGALIICADSGAEAARAWGLQPHQLIGDMDSISPALLAELQTEPNLEISILPVEKDETDLEAALYVALERAASEITVLGGLGGRLDHTLGNLYLLAAPRLLASGAKVRLLGEREEIFCLHGGETLQIAGQPGELLSLIPLGGQAEGITTTNLYYPLKGEALLVGPSRGISNHFTNSIAKISLERGLLLAIHTFSA